MAKKIDGVIESVHYKNGQIVYVRGYLRRGFTFSDWVLMDRKTLVEKIKNGGYFVVGSREEFKASTFQTGNQVMLVKDGEHEWISTRADAKKDEVEGAPVV